MWKTEGYFSKRRNKDGVIDEAWVLFRSEKKKEAEKNRNNHVQSYFGYRI